MPADSTDPIASARTVMSARTAGEWRASSDGSVRAAGPIRGEHGQHFNRLIVVERFAPEDASAIAHAVNTHEPLLAALAAFVPKPGWHCDYCGAVDRHESDCPVGLALAALTAEQERR